MVQNFIKKDKQKFKSLFLILNLQNKIFKIKWQKFQKHKIDFLRMFLYVKDVR